MLNKNSIQPLYKQLMDIITGQLKNGTYKPGEKIPTEPKLAELYQVSRITVRRTIEELCTQGYLIKHQGKGTFVKSPMIFRKFESQKNMSFSESCRQSGRVPGSHVPDFDPKVLENGSFFEYLKSAYRYSIADFSRSTVSVTTASSDMAQTLSLAPGDPVMILDSYMQSPDGAPLYISREYIAGSRYTISF